MFCKNGCRSPSGQPMDMIFTTDTTTPQADIMHAKLVCNICGQVADAWYRIERFAWTDERVS